MMCFPKASSMSWALLAFLGGCAGVAFTEADLGQTKPIHLGSSFSITLPHYGKWKNPRLNANVARFLGYRVDESAERDVFTFRAEGEGETDILIAADSQREKDRNFTMRVRVVDEADAMEADEWNDRWNWTRSGPRDRE